MGISQDVVVKRKGCVNARNNGSSWLVSLGADVQIRPGYEGVWCCSECTR